MIRFVTLSKDELLLKLAASDGSKKRLFLIDRWAEEINPAEDLCAIDLAFTLTHDNSDNRFEFFEEVEENENNE